MNEQGHVEPEELAGFLYEELDAAARMQVTAHLAECAACREMVAQWKEARGMLQEWKLAERAPAKARRSAWPGTMRVAAAVGLVVAGFAAARLTAPPAPKGASREEMEAQVKASTGQILQQLAEQAHRQEVLEGAVALTLRNLETRRTVEEAALRRDLETVAMQTQVAFQGLGAGQESRSP